MKMLFYQIKGWGPGAVAVEHEQDEKHPYNMVLGEMLSFELRHPRYCQIYLNMADRVEREGGGACEVLHDMAWRTEIRPTQVLIEYEYDDVGDEWKAIFPFDQVRRAVRGWMRFLEMPESDDRRLVVDLDADE